jgi:hypothetical protein
MDEDPGRVQFANADGDYAGEACRRVRQQR